MWGHLFDLPVFLGLHSLIVLDRSCTGGEGGEAATQAPTPCGNPREVEILDLKPRRVLFAPAFCKRLQAKESEVGEYDSVREYGLPSLCGPVGREFPQGDPHPLQSPSLVPCALICGHKLWAPALVLVLHLRPAALGGTCSVGTSSQISGKAAFSGVLLLRVIGYFAQGAWWS